MICRLTNICKNKRLCCSFCNVKGCDYRCKDDCSKCKYFINKEYTTDEEANKFISEESFEKNEEKENNKLLDDLLDATENSTVEEKPKKQPKEKKEKTEKVKKEKVVEEKKFVDTTSEIKNSLLGFLKK